MSSRLFAEHENAVCHAGMDRRHPDSQDASGYIHVSLGFQRSMLE
jgi:hypothetical protein